MSSNKYVLYHWTHRSNLDSIEVAGLDPAKAAGELFAVWGCEFARKDWALEHVKNRHKWQNPDMILLRMHVRGTRVYRTCWDGVFYTPERVLPVDITVEHGRYNWITLTDYLDMLQNGTPV